MNARTLALATAAAATLFGAGCSSEPEGSDDISIELDENGNMKDSDGTKQKTCNTLLSLDTKCGAFCW